MAKLEGILAAALAAAVPSLAAASEPCGCGPCGPDEAPRLVRLVDGGWAVLSATVAAAWPIEAATATAAAANFSRGRLACSGPKRISSADLTSVEDGSRMHAPIEQPVLGLRRGVVGEGTEAEAAFATVLEQASLRTHNEDVLPLELGPPRWRAVPGGAAQVRWLTSPLIGPVQRLVGPVLRLGRAAEPDVAPSFEPAPSFVGRAAAIRVAMDAERRGGRLESVDWEVPGVGVWSRPVVRASPERADRSGVGYRLAVAHGGAAGFGAASILVAVFDVPECKVLCDDTPPLGIDAAFLRRFVAKESGDVDRARRTARGLDIAMAAVSALAALVPSGRHGILSRWEILEDMLILAEGAMIAYTTPLSLEARFGRARPLAFHPVLGPQAGARTRVGPPLMAYGANRSGAWIGGVLTMLAVEEAPWGYILAAGATLGGLAVASAYFEVEAGLAYPSDIPISLVYGAINGAGTVLWHRWFWSGWPGAREGAMPLRLEGLSVTPTDGGAALMTRLSF